jgi:tRNA (cmo5U34)-methyltransferase
MNSLLLKTMRVGAAGDNGTNENLAGPQPNGLGPLTIDDFFYVQCDDYDECIEVSIPHYKLLHQELMRCLPFDQTKPLRVLDLGVGTGKTLGLILDAFPQSRGTGVDLFEKMLNRARSNLARHVRRTEYIKGDIRKIRFEPASFDLVVSVLAVHHLRDREKQAVFRSVAQWLSPGGLFVLGDWTSFADPQMERIATEVAHSHVMGMVKRGEIPQATADAWVVHWRDVNLPAPVEDQLGWMRQAGFSHASCVFRYYGIALMLARE